MLKKCEDAPNCACSMYEGKHYVKPITYHCKKKCAYEFLINLLVEHPRAGIIEAKSNYIRAIFETKFLKFKDDVEFFFAGPNVIHMRSASRVGYYDFGVNKKRLNWIRKMFNKYFGGKHEN